MNSVPPTIRDLPADAYEIHFTRDTSFIYAMVDPRDERIRYIGQTMNPHMRMATALSGDDCNPSKIEWVQKLKALGLTPRLFILETVTREHKDAAEERWIQHFRSIGADLLNSHRGKRKGYRMPIERTVAYRRHQEAARLGITDPKEIRRLLRPNVSPDDGRLKANRID